MAKDLNLNDLKTAANAPGRLDLIGAPEGFDALIMADIVKARGVLSVFVARDSSRAEAFAGAFSFFAKDIEVLRLPSWDCLPYDRIGPSAQVAADRISGLVRLARGVPAKTPLLLVTTGHGLLQRVPPREVLSAAGFTAAPGQDIDLPKLEQYFAVNGYVRASTVSERGEYAVRGGVIDVFAPGAAEPVRLDLFGDTLESIRAFDPDTQRSTKQMKSIDLTPVSEVLLSEESIARFRQGFVAEFGAPGDDPIYAAVSEGQRRAGFEHWFPLFYGKTETLFDYIGPDALIALDHLAQEARDERLAMIEDAYEARTETARTRAAYRPLPPTALYLTPAEWDEALSHRANRRFTPFQSDAGNVLDLGARMGRNFAAERAQDSVHLFEAAAAHAETLSKAGKRVLFASWSEGSSERMGAMLGDHGLGKLRFAPYWDAARSADPKLPQRVVLPLDNGFETDSLAVISETDILGDRLARPRKKRRAQNFLAEASALTAGDLVVHIDHGIGRYTGLTALEVQGAPHDCLELHYAADAKLYLPVENIDLLTRYGADTESATLDRLGGAAWQARKAKAKERLREMAEGLIRIAAARSVKSLPETDTPQGVFDEFCARFPYEETEDQLNAVTDVIGDLASGRPMDRLICGDVGFGKTEVALRAAFVVAMSGKQVAVVCPTTLLARQHFKTFRERFQGWPVKLRQLSRMVSAKEAAETREALARGEIDIVIGTHALLSEQVKFAQLGLVVVDEEQHFGVKHKEKLKALRTGVHMLTLSATPIPRTLQMALSGIRELSLIATPPVDRLAVRTNITPWDPVTIREALLREKYRGGQSYFVAPRVTDLPKLEKFLRDHVPEVKFTVGHGQMAARQLEDVMAAFYEGEYDVLLSTTIVESGLDIPTANTLIIHRADMFGLAQLYQLRGRVGRAKARAYAYMTTPVEKQITHSAEKRLRVLQSLDSLGAGFQLASHDLDIRGGGNLLGEEQSGHIREVGVELYQQMLEDAVAEMRAGGARELDEARGWSPQINTGVAVLIPEEYVPDLNVRLSLYRRLSEVEDELEIDAVGAELADRFGPLPEEVKQLLQIVAIKALARRANVEKIDAGPKGVVLSLRDNSFADPEGLVRYIRDRGPSARVRPDMKVVFFDDWERPDVRLKGVAKILRSLVGL
ncbi:MAG: transcription-repair coupling factor, partial [Caulobacteraceae bacterium]